MNIGKEHKATLNVILDNYAMKALASGIERQRLYHRDSNLYHIIHDPETLQYWCKDHHNMTARLSKDSVVEIDWEGSAKLFENIPFSRRRWNVKHASENCGVGSTLQLWEWQDQRNVSVLLELLLQPYEDSGQTLVGNYCESSWNG